MSVFRTPYFDIQLNPDQSVDFHITRALAGFLTHAILQARPQGTHTVQTSQGTLRVHVHVQASTTPSKPHTPIEER
jgi:hypothetical protein